MSELYDSPRTERVSILFGQVNQIEVVVANILQSVPTMTDSELMEGVRLMDTIHKATYAIRGAMLNEMRKRAEKQAGGRGRLDTNGLGFMAAERLIAEHAGVSAATVRQDGRIMEAFGDQILVPAPETHSNGLRPLMLNPELPPREVFDACLLAGDRKQEALQFWYEHKATIGDGYTAYQFAQDVRARFLNQTLPVQGEPVFWLNIPLDSESHESLRQLKLRWAMDNKGVVEALLKRETK